MRMVLLIFLFFTALMVGCQDTTNVNLEADNNLASANSTLESESLAESINTPTLEVFTSVSFLENEIGSFEMSLVNESIQEPNRVLVNSTGEYQVYTSCITLCFLYIENLFSSDVYIMTSNHLDGRRGYRNIEWIDDKIFQFTLVTQPRYGVRYIIDVEKRTLINIEPLSPN